MPLDGNPAEFEVLDVTAKVCLRAAEMVERGWFGNRPDHGPQKNVCLLIAISEAVNEIGGNRYVALARLGFPRAIDGVCWNDAKGRTKAEVIDLLRTRAYA